ncbi:MAG: GAF domain-containing protein [Clostridia bacterium]|nr:GAF domain-containing protein [Clostridia bacterium]
METVDYASIATRLESLMASTLPLTAFSNASSLIFHELNNVSWVGFYFYDNRSDKLILGPFQGKPACVEIERGKGVCGRSLDTGSTVVVPDVLKFPGHIACDADSRSEIVIPVKVYGQVYALLDIDSKLTGRFTAEDSAGLEKVVRVIEKYSEDYIPFDFL